MLVDGVWSRTFNVSRLYFRHIHGSRVSEQIDPMDLAKVLHIHGFIVLDGDRYAQTKKWNSRACRDELNEVFRSLGLELFKGEIL